MRPKAITNIIQPPRERLRNSHGAYEMSWQHVYKDKAYTSVMFTTYKVGNETSEVDILGKT